MRNFQICRRFRQAGDPDRVAGNVDQAALLLDKKMVVVGRVSVEISALAADGDFAQQARRLELVQGVVNGGERNPFSGAYGLLVQQLGGDMPIAIAEPQRRQRNALARRPHAGPPQEVRNKIAHSAGHAGGDLRQARSPSDNASRNFDIAALCKYMSPCSAGQRSTSPTPCRRWGLPALPAPGRSWALALGTRAFERGASVIGHAGRG